MIRVDRRHRHSARAVSENSSLPRWPSLRRSARSAHARGLSGDTGPDTGGSLMRHRRRIRVDPGHRALRTTGTSNAPAWATQLRTSTSWVAVEHSGQITSPDADVRPHRRQWQCARGRFTRRAAQIISENGAPICVPSFTTPARITVESAPVEQPTEPCPADLCAKSSRRLARSSRRLSRSIDKTSARSVRDRHAPKKKATEQQATFQFSDQRLCHCFECNLAGNLGFSPCTSPGNGRCRAGE